MQALPVVLGANIGTTFSSQVFAVGIDQCAPVLMLAGFLLRMTVKKHHAKDWGSAIFGIGLVLFGLHTIDEAAEPLKDQPPVTEWLKTMATPDYGILAGAAITVAIQSSSAVLGIIITLAGQGIIPLEAGIAMMLGAEIGTCADTLALATLFMRHPFNPRGATRVRTLSTVLDSLYACQHRVSALILLRQAPQADIHGPVYQVASDLERHLGEVQGAITDLRAVKKP